MKDVYEVVLIPASGMRAALRNFIHKSQDSRISNTQFHAIELTPKSANTCPQNICSLSTVKLPPTNTWWWNNQCQPSYAGSVLPDIFNGKYSNANVLTWVTMWEMLTILTSFIKRNWDMRGALEREVNEFIWSRVNIFPISCFKLDISDFAFLSRLATALSICKVLAASISAMRLAETWLKNGFFSTRFLITQFPQYTTIQASNKGKVSLVRSYF